MKIIIKKSELIKLLKFCDRIISDNRNNTINPILSFLYLKINQNGCYAVCSNGITSGHYDLDQENINIQEEGTILVRPKILLNIVSKLKEKEIELHKVDNAVLMINTPSFNAQINIVDENSYPMISFNYDGFQKMSFNLETIQKINQKVAWATLPSGDQTKILNGILFDTETITDQLSVIATDSYKLAYLAEPRSGIIPLKFVLDTNILKIVSDLVKNENANPDLDFYVDTQSNNKNILIKSENMLFLNKTIEGNYPTSVYNAFNIRENTKIKIDKSEFVQALERGQIFVASDKNPMVTLNISHQGMQVEFVSYELGSSDEKVDLIAFDGQDIKVSVNAYYLLALLRAIDKNEVNLNFESNTKPIIIFSEEEKDFKELVLPLRVN